MVSDIQVTFDYQGLGIVLDGHVVIKENPGERVTISLVAHEPFTFGLNQRAFESVQLSMSIEEARYLGASIQKMVGDMR